MSSSHSRLSCFRAVVQLSTGYTHACICKRTVKVDIFWKIIIYFLSCYKGSVDIFHVFCFRALLKLYGLVFFTSNFF